jgi:5,10-methylenetetrahydromethanopterin reductase
MVNAAATAALVAMAPGRVVIGFGTGFTGRRAMGYGAITWGFMRRYIEAYTALLRGDTIEWEGARMRMLHPAGSAAPRPVEVPIIISAFGPKGRAITHELGDGLFASVDVAAEAKEFPWVSYLYWGTVREDGEVPGSERERSAAGPGWALAYHGTYELGGPQAVRAIPGGEWLAVLDEQPEIERHLHVHLGHCIALKRRRSGCVEGRRWRTRRPGHRDGHSRRGAQAAGRSRRTGRDRGGVPTRRPRHPPRVGTDDRRGPPLTLR